MMGGIISFFVAILLFALWLEYRHLCKCQRSNKPYELVDHQREMRDRGKEDEGR